MSKFTAKLPAEDFTEADSIQQANKATLPHSSASTRNIADMSTACACG
jgi:hypothetical protein